MAKINSSKLLPPSKSSSAIVVRNKNLPNIREKKSNISSAFKPIDFKSSAIIKFDDIKDINGKLVKIESFLSRDLISSKKKTEKKRKEQEKQDFEKEEKKLETLKVKKFKFPKLFSSPSIGLFDRLKTFLFYTALGWFLPKIIEFMPKLNGIIKFIGTAYSFGEKIFSGLFNGFMTLVKFRSDIEDKALGFIAETERGNYEKKFQELEKLFNTFTDASIVAGLLAVDIGGAAINEYNKWKKKNSAPKPGGGPGGTTPYSYDPKRALVRKKYGDSAAKLYDLQIAKGKNSKQALDIVENRYIKKGKIAPQRMTGSLGGTKPGSNIFGRGFGRSFGRAALNLFGKPKLPAWMQKLTSKLKGSPFSKLAGPFSRFLGAAVPFAGAAIGEMDARSRFASGDNIGGWLARTSAILDGFAGTTAAIGGGFLASIIGAPVAAFLGAASGIATGISMTIDAILLVRDILNVFGVKTFSRGGKIVRSYQGGGTAGTKATPRRTYTPTRKKPFKVSPQKTQPGKDVGGDEKIKTLYPDTNSKKPLSILGWINAGMPGPGQYRDYVDEFTKENKQQEKPNPYLSLISTSKSLKSLSRESGIISGIPNSRDAIGYLFTGIGNLMGSAVDVALGQKPDRRVYQSFSSGLGYLVDSLVNQRMQSTLRGFADGGSIEPSRELKNVYGSMSSADLISKAIGPSIEQRVNEAIQSIQKELQKIRKEEKKPPEQQGGPDIGGGIESIDISGMSAEDVDVLGRMVQAESGGESDIGKAAVLAVILNRYRLIRSGRVPPGEFKVVNKPKDKITIRDIIFASGQFSPINDGRFAGTSSSSGKTALAAAIRMGGNDPQKLKENLIRVGKLNEADADYVLRSTFFSAPDGRTTIPGGRAREVMIGGHSFQQSGSSRLLGRIETIGATVSQSTLSTIKLDFKKLGLTVGERAGSMARGRPHNGRDIAIQQGTPLRALSDAVIVYSDFQGKGPGDGYGWTIIYREKNGREHLYGHMREKSKFKPGDVVPANTILGYVGSTGDSSGPHLHWEVSNKPGEVGFKRNNIIDPLEIGYKATDPFGGGTTIESPRPTQQPQGARQQPGRPPSRPQQSGRQQGSSPLRENSIENALIALSKRDEYIPFEHNGKRFVFKVFPNLSMVVWPSTPFNDKLPNSLPLFGGRRIEPTSPEFKLLAPSIRKKINSMYTLSQVEEKKGGGLIAPSKPNRPIPNSFASYETYGSGMIFALQQVFIEKESLPRSHQMIMFPVAVSVNSSMNNLSLSRG